jgi:hypothetical protein
LNKFSAFPLGALLLFSTAAGAGQQSDIAGRYPNDAYFVGIGSVQTTGNTDSDKRRATILARLEIAKSIKVTVQEHTVDMICSRGSGPLDADSSSCKNEFSMIVEESVSQVLEGSSIVEAHEDHKNNTYVAIAILPKAQAARKSDQEAAALKETAERHLAKARESALPNEKNAEIEIAKDDLKKALVFEGQKIAIQNVKNNSDNLFDNIIFDLHQTENR